MPIQLVEATEKVTAELFGPDGDALLSDLVEQAMQVEDEGIVLLCQGGQLRVQCLDTLADPVDGSRRQDRAVGQGTQPR